MNNKAPVKGKLGQVAQIHVCCSRAKKDLKRSPILLSKEK